MQSAFSIFERVRVAPPASAVAAELATAALNESSFATTSIASMSESSFATMSIASVSESPFAETSNGSRQISIAILCAVAAFLTGCGAHQKPRARAFSWSTAKNIRPLTPQTISSDVSNEDLFADLGLAVPAPPSPVAGMNSAPPRPRVAVAPTTGGGASRAPEAPMIAPQLSAEQTAEAQQQTSASVSIAEKNIAASQGRSLNAMQLDLASKVRSFLAEAREAARVSDWTRASSAAKKAEVLSQELAGSL
jgi:hypothetical protein